MTDDLPTAREIIATHDEIEDEYISSTRALP